MPSRHSQYVGLDIAVKIFGNLAVKVYGRNIWGFLSVSFSSQPVRFRSSELCNCMVKLKTKQPPPKKACF